EWVHVQLHQQKGMISLSPPTICNSAFILTSLNQLTTLLPSPAFFQNSPAAVWRSDLARNRICAAGNAQRI
ncbi:hypothetical protein, partial [Raoultella planticola]|uniref:hypothetical protein n=1 Tax=Raoultella planticola TaxID=575 RepID=UPI001BD2992F